MVKMSFRYPTILDNPTDLSEANLVLAARKGSLEAFNSLVLIHQDSIFNLANWIVGDEVLAEDITQKTFLSAYRNLPSFRNGSFRAWLNRIAKNSCYDVLRYQKRHPTSPLDNEDEPEERSIASKYFRGNIRGPEQEYERRESERNLHEALNQLDRDQRAAIVLVDLQDLDYKEVAQILGVPLGTLKSRVARARTRLRDLLGPWPKSACLPEAAYI